MLTQIEYNRQRAVEYARKWALSRNPLFTDFTGGGGNCTNFISQCLLAGAPVMNFTPTFGWYYRAVNDRAPAWSSVESLYDFLTRSNDFSSRTDDGPFGEVARTGEDIEIGDVVQLANSTGDFYHTLIISGFSDGDILVCANSDNSLDRPLSTYNFASMRILHILGSMLDVPTEETFSSLFDSRAIQVIRAVAENV
jgi:hypothetical protein